MLGIESNPNRSDRVEGINELGYVMVRPDGLQIGADEEIIRRITDSRLEVLKRKLSIINPKQVDDLYPRLLEEPYYPSMKQSLAGKKVMSLVVGGSTNVGDTLLELKGSALHTSGSIRGDFSRGHLLSGDMYKNYLMGCLSEEQLQSPEWGDVMREDRMHSDETTDEAVNSIKVMFQDHELRELVSRFPSLHTLLLDS